MSTPLRQQRQQLHHHHHENSRSQTQLSLHKLSSIITSSSTNLQINLIEPILYFRGNAEESVGCFLRGNLILNLSKPTKIRKIEMKFAGRMKTFWPEGKLYYGSTANRNDLCEEQEIMTHNWTFVSPPTSSFETLPQSSSGSSSCRFRLLRSCSSSALATSKSHLIPAGTHKYPFELFIPGNIPETIEAERGTVNYKLSAVAVRSGLSPNLHVSQNVTIIRTVLEERNSEGIAIASGWNNQLSYEITIPKRAYPIGDSIDIDLKLIPRTKIKIDGIKIQIEEESIYKSRGQKNLESRTLLVHKVDNFAERKIVSGKDNSINNDNNDNNDITQEANSPIQVHEIEYEDLENLSYHKNISLPIPKCTNPIYYSYKSSSINISHHLKFIFTIMNFDNNDDCKKKKKKIEVKEVDVPITILSCRCADDLPQYGDESYNLHQYSDSSPSYESPPSYEQSNNGRNYLRSEIRHNSTNTITTIMTQPIVLHRLLTV